MTEQDWQSAVDSSLVTRLMRPLVQPGAISSQLGASILARTEQMTNHLPLLVQFAERQAGVFQPEQIPIVYAQPSSSVEVVHSHTETATEPLTIVQATLISNSTLNDPTSNLTNLSTRQDHNYTSNSMNLSVGELRQESEIRSIAVPSSQRSLSSQTLSIVYARTISNKFNSDRSNHMLTVRPLISGNPKPQSSLELANSQGNSLPQVTPTISKKSGSSTSSSTLIVRTNTEVLALPTITVRTGIEAAPPAATWQTRTHLNETATTLPIVFAQPNPAPSSPQSTSRASLDSAQFSEFSSSFPPVTETFSSPPSAPPINLDTLTTQVERKLLRRLVVESERRGQTRWR